MSFVWFTKYTCNLYFRLAKQCRCFSENGRKIKFSYYHEKGTFSFLQSTLGDLVDEAADDSGDDICLSFPFQNVEKTYYQFKEETDQLAAGLLTLGLRIGDRIAIYGPNSYHWLLAEYAALKAGLTVVSINPASTVQELEHSLQKMGCAAIVSAESFKKRDYYKTLSAVVPEILQSRPGQINSQRLAQLKIAIMISQKSHPGTYQLQEVMQADDTSARRLLHDTRKKIQFDSPALVMFTSGTTGTPKAAVASHFQVLNQTIPFLRRVGFDNEKPVACIHIPVFHSFANVVGIPVSFQCRGKGVFPAEHFDPISSLNAIEKESCTVVYGVPTMFIEILRQLRRGRYNIQNWRKVIVGAAPVADELAKALRDECALNVMVVYGSTEACSAVTLQSPDHPNKAPGSTGKPVEYIELKIVDKDGNIVPVGIKGEVLSRSPFTFLGYWNEPQKTTEVLDNTRWYHTGDIGRMDEEGNVYITGRIKDMVIRGGVNTYPSEIENFLLTHPSIEDVYVVGVPDQRLGEELCALVKLKAGYTATEDEIRGFCKDKISYFKIPRYIIFTDNYPKTESGKVMKYKLREECIQRLKL